MFNMDIKIMKLILSFAPCINMCYFVCFLFIPHINFQAQKEPIKQKPNSLGFCFIGSQIYISF